MFWSWQQIGEDALGDWPVAYVHKKKGHLRLVVRHNTPEDYKTVMRRAAWMTFALFVGWCYIAYLIVQGNQHGQPITTAGGWMLAGAAIGTLFIPNYLAERRMKKHPKTGRSVACYTIKKNLLRAHDGKTEVAQYHSATATEHVKATEGSKRGGGKAPTTEELYLLASQMRVNAGHFGVRKLGVISFYNDPTQQYAGLAAAGVDYLVTAHQKLARLETSPTVGRQAAAKPVI